MIAPLVGLALMAAASGGGAAGSGDLPPRIALSTTSLSTNDSVTIRVLRPAAPRGREIRVYLVPSGEAASVRSRFDARLSYLGSLPSTRGARATVTVPPLEAGRYALAYWCGGCLPRLDGVGLQASPALTFTGPTGGECPVTIPNRNRPPGATGGWRFHGNGRLWAVVPADGIVTTNPLGGEKLVWAGLVWAGAPLSVRYRPFGVAGQETRASVVSGSMGGYDGPSWASRMSFQPGCWQITARQLDVSLSYVAQVVVPASP